MKQSMRKKWGELYGVFAAQCRSFWMMWSICLLLLVSAFYAAGSVFAAIAFGGILGCIGAMLLGEMGAFVRDGAFDAVSAGIAVLAAIMASAGFFVPVKWTIVAGCLLSSGLLLSFLLKRLDNETGMNIQTGMWLGSVLTAMLCVFLYAGPYANIVHAGAYLLAVGLYCLFLLNLANGAEQGLQAAWYVALIIGIACLGGTAFNLLGIDPDPSITFSGLATGLGCTMLYSPIKQLLATMAKKHEEDWRDFL
ncbi:hypothetical protein [Halodesulfovibrio marinisediminis]|uniref:Uncharacterized protein n=1 Tax=Halodesulfovibrio marinisediminis DSM 17456 TaxID=1121457 RepID=A0A1N6ISV4_9BACT|nr:hypothetical protein [Halodesulfovibrio marinisediminis]SIO35063.1 hypothetical protein SAMN02745161_2893 [Halodesulfovibrio marinisediminis DSM 17456]